MGIALMSMRRLRGSLLGVSLWLLPLWLFNITGMWTEISRQSASIYPPEAELIVYQSTRFTKSQDATKAEDELNREGRRKTTPKLKGAVRNANHNKTTTKSDPEPEIKEKEEPRRKQPQESITDTGFVPLDWLLVKDVDVPQEPFVRYDKVVVATKVFGYRPRYVLPLKQMLCLFTAAYNRHANYDIVVFTTEPWEPHQMQEVQAVVPQTKLVFVLEGPPLEEQLAAMTPQELDFLYQRCKIHPYGEKKELEWIRTCTDGEYSYNTVPLAYAWQSEFRAFHIWKMPALAQYKYMLWMDTDAMCTKPWTTDPMKVMVENDLVLMFANRFDIQRPPLLLEKLQRVYNRTICNIELDVHGRFLPKTVCRQRTWGGVLMPEVHGFHHITNLDFYRSKTNLKFLEILVETHRFSREWDDQLAVTIPPAMEAPDRAWEYKHNGIELEIFHNNFIDGRMEQHVNDTGFISYWRTKVEDKWDVAREMCDALIVDEGRR